MNGKDLKEKLREEGVNRSDLADKMGYKTDQNLHSVLGAADVKSSVIERISSAMGKPIGWLYGEITGAVVGDQNTLTDVHYTNTPDSLMQQLEEKDEQISRLLGIIEKLSAR